MAPGPHWGPHSHVYGEPPCMFTQLGDMGHPRPWLCMVPKATWHSAAPFGPGAQAPRGSPFTAQVRRGSAWLPRQALRRPRTRGHSEPPAPSPCRAIPPGTSSGAFQQQPRPLSPWPKVPLSLVSLADPLPAMESEPKGDRRFWEDSAGGRGDCRVGAQHRR